VHIERNEERLLCQCTSRRGIKGHPVDESRLMCRRQVRRSLTVFRNGSSQPDGGSLDNDGESGPIRIEDDAN
jgi:hypothetical protein